MNATLAVRPEARLARPLKVLVPLIQDDITNAQKAGLEYYRAAGEKLQEARTTVSRSEWGGWLRDNFGISQDTARNYMNLAGEMEFREVFENELHTNSDRAPRRQPREFKTLSEFARPNSEVGHHPVWHAPVKEAIDSLNVPRMRQEQQDREKEQKLQRQLGLQLIDIGYRVLATKLHPDKGGSAEAMVRLQTVRNKLKGAI